MRATRATCAWMVMTVGAMALCSCDNGQGGKQPSPQAQATAAGNPIVVIDTSMGKIRVELLADRAPRTVANFLKYVDDRHYDYTIFHRVNDEFMIQGGGFTPDLKEKPTREAIPNEAGNGLKNLPGTVAMARTSEPHSATSQFFINTMNNTETLDHKAPTQDGYGYAVFGKVVGGMDVVHKIGRVPTTSEGPWQWKPTEPVIIRSIRREG